MHVLKIKIFVRLILLILPLQTIGVVSAQPNAIPSPAGGPNAELQAQIDLLTLQLEVLINNDPIEILVDCTAQETIADAMASVGNSDAPLTITIRGMCNENLSIQRDDVTLIGETPVDGIKGGISVIGGTARININSLSIENTGAGLGCFHNSGLLAVDVTITGGNTGVFAFDGGQCRLINSIIDGSRTGILVANHSHVDLEGTQVLNSILRGVNAFSGGSLTAQRGTEFIGNNVGLVFSTNSSGYLHEVLISNGNSDGLVVRSGATVKFTGSSLIKSNGGDGMSLESNATAEAFGTFVTTTKVQIINNDGDGIRCDSTAVFVGGDAGAGAEMILTGNGIIDGIDNNGCQPF